MGGVIEYSQAADEDLLSLHAYLAQRSPQIADRVIRQLDAKCRLLAESPGRGARRDRIRPGMRMGVLGKFLIFYRIDAAGIFIVRIVHGSRDLRKLFPAR